MIVLGALAAASISVQGQEVPAPPTPARELEFTGPEAGWPPRVAGATNIQLLPVHEDPSGFTAAFETRVREVVAASPLVQNSLGDRFVFIGVDPVEATSGARRCRRSSG